MGTDLGRRAVVVGLPVALVAGAAYGRGRAAEPEKIADAGVGVSSAFPGTDPALAREMVGVSHANLNRVNELLAEAPQLANAAWDWGFGDWETALGAASHTGRREIAGALMDHGARPDVFTMAMLGRLEAVRAMVEAQPGLHRTKGPHGLTLMHHARAGGEGSAAVVEYLTALGGADTAYVDRPLNEEQRRVYVGVYAFGEGTDERLEVIEQTKGQPLGIRRVGSGGTARGLFHQGEHTFHPAGAPDVRVVFVVEGERAVAVHVGAMKPMRAV